MGTFFIMLNFFSITLFGKAEWFEPNRAILYIELFTFTLLFVFTFYYAFVVGPRHTRRDLADARPRVV